jgi:hypothetical protein
MTLTEFNTQSLSLRTETVYEWGFFISSHKSAGINKVLYAVNGFFAEESIALATNKVVDVKAFSNKELSNQDLAAIRSKKPFLLRIPGILG